MRHYREVHVNWNIKFRDKRDKLHLHPGNAAISQTNIQVDICGALQFNENRGRRHKDVSVKTLDLKKFKFVSEEIIFICAYDELSDNQNDYSKAPL